MSLLMFDMDGTLINSGEVIAQTINHVRVNLGLEVLEKSYILKNVNEPHVNAASFFYGTPTFTKEQTYLFETYYNKNCLNNLELYDGIPSLLEELNEEFTLTIATNASSNFAKKMLEHLNINKYFDTVLGYNDVVKAKPHPEMVNKILTLHDMCKTKAQLIGDSKKDILAAQNAGVDSVLVNWGFSDHKEDVIENIDELKREIRKKFN